MYKVVKPGGQGKVYKAKRLSDGKIFIAKQNEDITKNVIAENEA